MAGCYEDPVVKTYHEPEIVQNSFSRRREIWVLPYKFDRAAHRGVKTVILLFQYLNDDYIEKAWVEAIEMFSRLLSPNESAPDPNPQETWKDNVGMYPGNNPFMLQLAVAYVERDLECATASIYYQQGRAKEACELYKAGLVKKERVLSPDHPGTLKNIECLARTCNDVGEQDQALHLLEKLLVINKRIYGEHHFDTLKCMNDLVETNIKLGKMAAALNILETALETSKNVFGLEHPNTMCIMYNLAETYRSLGKVTKALFLHQSVLAMRTRILGEDHPDTLKSMNNLADMYQTLGNIGKSLELRKKVKITSERKFDPERSNAFRRMNNLAATYRDLEGTRDVLNIQDEFFTARKSMLSYEESNSFQNPASLSLASSGVDDDRISTYTEIQVDCQQTADDACKAKIVRQFGQNSTSAFSLHLPFSENEELLKALLTSADQIYSELNQLEDWSLEIGLDIIPADARLCEPANKILFTGIIFSIFDL